VRVPGDTGTPEFAVDPAAQDAHHSAICAQDGIAVIVVRHVRQHGKRRFKACAGCRAIRASAARRASGSSS
jgi:hypothetical protein